LKQYQILYFDENNAYSIRELGIVSRKVIRRKEKGWEKVERKY
jgi:hypothetical protein